VHGCNECRGKDVCTAAGEGETGGHGEIFKAWRGAELITGLVVAVHLVGQQLDGDVGGEPLGRPVW